MQVLETIGTPQVKQYPLVSAQYAPSGLAEWTEGNVQPLKLQYSRKEAKELLNIGLRTLDRLIAGKQLPVRRVGRRVLITGEALKQFTRRDHATQ